MAIRSYKPDLKFTDMEVTEEGSIHTDGFRIEYCEDKYYIRVQRVYINNDADEVPYWAKLRIYPKELEFINNVLTKAKELGKVQIGLSRCRSGILGIMIFD